MIDESERPARVIFVEVSRRVGGAEQVKMELCRGLHRYGIEAGIVSMYSETSVPPDFSGDDVLLGHGLARGRSDPLALLRLARLFQRRRVDLVCVDPGPLTLIYSWIASALAGRPVLTAAVHVSTFADDPWRRRAIRPLMLRRMNAVLALSERHRLELLREFQLEPGRVVVIPNGVQPWRGPELVGGRGALDLPTSAPVVAVLAKLVPYKGHDVLLRAVALARQRLPDLRLLVIGEGPRRASLEHLVTELGLKGVVELLGHRPDARAILPLVDLVALSSVTKEALPLAVIEAMAAARPVVATRVGYVDDLVIDGVTGKLAPCGDPEALADAIVWVLERPRRARSLGLAGLARYEAHFTGDRMIQRFASVAWNLMGTRSAQRQSLK